MRIVIDANELVSDATALKMVLQILEREDGEYNFSDGTVVEVKTAKTQKSFKFFRG